MSDDRPNHDQPRAGGVPDGWTPPPGPDLTGREPAPLAPAFVPGVPAQPTAPGEGHAAAPITGPDGAWYGPDAYAPGGYTTPGQPGLVPPAHAQQPAPGQPAHAQPGHTGSGHAQPGYAQQQPYAGPHGYPGAPPAHPGQPGGYPGPYAGQGWGRPLPPLASWGSRVGALLIDSAIASGPFLISYLVTVVVAVGASGAAAASGDADTMPTAFGVGMGFAGLLLLATYAWSIGWVIFDRVIRQGRTGQSVGKRVVGLRLLSEHSMLPPGAGLTLGREFAHIADGALYIGYLWPLWDPKNQTFADKICSTVVVRA